MTGGADTDDDLLAAEYVLGALDLAERSAAEVRLRRDPAFALRVADWENRLSGLNDDFDEAAAPDLLPQIEARLFPEAAPAKARGWFWNLLGLALTTAAAVAIAAFLLVAPPQPDLSASLTAEASPLRYEASVSNNALTITHVAGSAAAPGTAYELWLISGQEPPVSLGLIEGEALTLPLQLAAPGVVLAISLEPAGGSPTGLPTGPVLVSGTLKAAL